MSNNWWTQGQRYTAPDGTEVLMRVGATLFIQPAHATKPYALIVVADHTKYGPGFNTGYFDFLDYLTDRRGTLICTEHSASVQYGNGPALAYNVTSPVGDLSGALGLRDIDKRQVPALLFAVEGSSELVYFSRWVHRPVVSTVDRLFLVEPRNGRRQSVVEVEEVYDETLRVPTNTLTLRINGKPAFVPMPGKPGNGKWGQRVLVQLKLDDYDITHSKSTGALLSIKPKG